MHTFEIDDWYFHHDGGFDGDVVIIHKPRPSWWASCRMTAGATITLVRIHADYPDNTRFSMEAVDNNDQKATIGVHLDHLRALVADRFVRRRLETWLENASDAALLGLLDLAAGLAPPEPPAPAEETTA